MTSLRRLCARAYLALWVFRWNEVVGGLWLLFYRAIYPDFTVGSRARIWGRFDVMMLGGGRITVGDEFHVVSSPQRSTITLYSRASLTVFPGGTITIGDRVGLNGTAITSKKSVRIGDGTMIAANVIIVDSDFHAQAPTTRWQTSTEQDDRPVVIGSNVWVGLNAVILKGVTIGDNSIIGAGSVVVHDLPADVIAGGNPARVLRPLYPSQSRAPE